MSLKNLVFILNFESFSEGNIPNFDEKEIGRVLGLLEMYLGLPEYL